MCGNFQNGVPWTGYTIDRRSVRPNRWLVVKIEPICQRNLRSCSEAGDLRPLAFREVLELHLAIMLMCKTDWCESLILHGLVSPAVSESCRISSGESRTPLCCVCRSLQNIQQLTTVAPSDYRSKWIHFSASIMRFRPGFCDQNGRPVLKRMHGGGLICGWKFTRLKTLVLIRIITDVGFSKRRSAARFWNGTEIDFIEQINTNIMVYICTIVDQINIYVIKSLLRSSCDSLVAGVKSWTESL